MLAPNQHTLDLALEFSQNGHIIGMTMINQKIKVG